MSDQLIDRFGRKIKSLRISVTSRCNQNCIYCHNEGEVKEKNSEIAIETVSKLVSAASSFGVKKVKFSGGEPLIRADFADIVSALPELDEISVTTNGTLLSRYARDLAEAGVGRVNISLDSLIDDKYRFITGSNRSMLPKVLAGIDSATEAGLTPIKLNMVLLRGINDSEISDMIEFAKGRALILQLIELMDFGNIREYQVDMIGIEDMLKSNAESIVSRDMHHRKKYFIDGAEVEVVRPIDNSEFCANCSRLRLTSDGKLKPCLLSNDNLFDINGLTKDEMREALKMAVSRREPFFRG
ncbi:MAG: GTP 3',8-cyclase MoaA [Halobacteriota archaeon]|nr:GTP 3',8-cyclase MoaA [Halobacteriota archaeon]